MTVKILQTDSKSLDFIELARMLDEDLVDRYGELQKQYDQYNKVAYIQTVIIIYMDKNPVACGAFKEYDANTAEIKRIFVKKEHRNQGLAKLLMNTLEDLVKSTGYTCALLETGIKQYEAIRFYKNIGYTVIQNYGPYIGDINSICMEKAL